METLSRIAVVTLLLAAPALGQSLSTDMAFDLGWQIALDREGFSPGVLDGKPRRKTAAAMQAFQQFQGLPATGRMNEPTSAALNIPAPAEVVKTYTITEQDAAKVTGMPTDWVERSKLPYTGYESLADLVAEKFQCTRGLLGVLNPTGPGSNLASLKVGDTLSVPAIQKGVVRKAHHLEVNLSEKIIRALDAQNKVVGLVHCSIAANAEKRPSGSTTVTAVIDNPDYLFDPQHWPEVRGVDRKLVIHPGPRNPVGVCWIALGLPGYGMHGTPRPELIGKTGSHGCFRLANWDAARLGKMIAPGAVVSFAS